VAISRLDGFVYNTKLVSPSDVPTTWLDLIKPRWKGKLFGPDVRSVPVNMGMLQLLRLKYGDDYLTALGKQSPRIVASMVTGVQLVAAGERDAAFGANKGHVNPLLASAPNAPVKMVRLGGPNFGFTWGAGVSAKSKNPAGGQLFVNWMLSAQGQVIFNTTQGTNGVLPKVVIPGADPLGPKFITVSTNVSQANQQKILSLLGLS
jgi:ABC-type Fe3+ transport system substrate-binding protein